MSFLVCPKCDEFGAEIRMEFCPDIVNDRESKFGVWVCPECKYEVVDDGTLGDDEDAYMEFIGQK